MLISYELSQLLYILLANYTFWYLPSFHVIIYDSDYLFIHSDFFTGLVMKKVQIREHTVGGKKSMK